MAAVVLVGGDGYVRVRAREKEQRGGASRKSERGPRGGVASPRMDRLEGGGLQREAGGGRRRRAPRLASAYWQRKKRTRGEGGGLGQREELGRLQVSGAR